MGASSKNWKVKRTRYVILNSLGHFQGREFQRKFCPPTSPLTQQQSVDNKLGLMLG